MTEENMNEKSTFRKKLLLAGGTFAGLIIVAAALLVLLPGDPDPNVLATEYVEANVDKLGEDVAEFVVGDNWLLKELGGEYVEDRINSVIKWSYSPARLVSSGRYEVTATAGAVFNVDYAILSSTFFVEVSLPFLLTIDVNNKTVVSEAQYSNASLEHDIPNVPDLPAIPDIGKSQEQVDEAKEKAEGLLQKLKK